MEEMLKDQRFAHVARDPKFRRIPKSERKVKIDKRFQSMFENKKFSVKYTVDKRGRPTNQSTKENLKKYYDLSSDEENEDDTDVLESRSKFEQKEKDGKIKVSSVQDNEKLSKKKKQKLKRVNEDTNEKQMKNVDLMKKNKLKKKENLKKGTIKQIVNNDENDEEQNKENDDVTDEEEEEEEDNASDYDNEDNDESNDEGDASDHTDDENIKKGKENMHKKCPEKVLISSKQNKKQLKLRRKDEKNLPEEVKEKLRDLRIDYARGEGVLFSDSSSEEEDESEEFDEDEDLVHDWGEFDNDAETTDTVTHRLAVCNMDWDKIRAVDLMVLFSSFLPQGHLIKSVTIYPSDFGLQRMKEEELKGPKELVEMKLEDNGELNEESEEEGSSYHREKLRQYQINRLKYYYAIVVCDCAESADKIYTECNGFEFELTGAKLDLRFVPDDTTFENEPRDICDKLPDLTKYKPRQFTTTALQQVKVDLTWDETDPARVEVFEKLNAHKFDEVDDSELRNYLASGSSDEEEEEHETEGTKKSDENNIKTKKMSTIEKYKALLKSFEEEEQEKVKNNEMEMEGTLHLNMKEKVLELVKDATKEEMTPFEEYVGKMKEKKKAKREAKKKLKKDEEADNSDSEDSIPSDIDMNDPYFAEEMQSMKTPSKKRKLVANAEESDPGEEKRKAELELLLMEKEDNKKHFNMKKIEEVEGMSKSKKKRLEKKNKKVKIEDDFEVDVNDPRFAAVYNSHLYNIDPSDPHYRKTKGTEALIQEKLKKRKPEESEIESQGNEVCVIKKVKSNLKKDELSALVKSVKQKTSGMKK